jgi:hypothetical protein
MDIILNIIFLAMVILWTGKNIYDNDLKGFMNCLLIFSLILVVYNGVEENKSMEIRLKYLEELVYDNLRYLV